MSNTIEDTSDSVVGHNTHNPRISSTILVLDFQGRRVGVGGGTGTLGSAIGRRGKLRHEKSRGSFEARILRRGKGRSRGVTGG